jgi:Ca2+-binding RTX toxin-like protein
LTQNYTPVVNTPTYTVTYLDSNVTATEGQDLVLRFKLDTKNHNGVTFRNSFSNLGNQFLQSDVVGAESRSNYIFPEVKFAAGSDYAEMRLGTIDDTSKELDEAVKAFGGSTTSNAYKLNFVGETLVTLQDNDWSATVNNVTNVSIVGNNNTVNVVNNTAINGTVNNDELVGTDGADTIKGGYGNDILKGGFGDDILTGNQDNDQLFGGEGADVLWGGYGDDLICPNQGNDISYGNQGADKFILCKGQDVIKDFNFAEGDRLLVFGDTSTVSYGLSSAGNLEVRRGTDITTLEGVTFATFDPPSAVLGMG